MNQIKIKLSVTNLCKFINVLFDINFKPEYFRLAKLNKNEQEVVNQFWDLLLNFCPKKFCLDRTAATRVKLYLASLNYECVEIYSLPNDGSYGSRELLLAFCWLIATHDVLNEKLKSIISEFSISKEFPEQNSEKAIDDFYSKFENINEYFDYALWLLNSINNNLKIIFETDKNVIKMSNKIHNETADSNSVPNLSINDMHALSNSEHCKKYITENKTVITLLQTKKEWEKEANTFWDWVTITLLEKQKEIEANKQISQTNLNEFYNILKEEVKTFLTNTDSKNNTQDSTIIDEKFHSNIPRIVLCTNNVQQLLKSADKEIMDSEKIYFNNNFMINVKETIECTLLSK